MFLSTPQTLKAFLGVAIVLAAFPSPLHAVDIVRKLAKKSTPDPTPDPTPGPKTMTLSFDALRRRADDVLSVGFEVDSLTTGDEPKPSMVGMSAMSYLNLFPHNTVTEENVGRLHSNPEGKIGTIDYHCTVTDGVAFARGMCQGWLEFDLDGEKAGVLIFFGGNGTRSIRAEGIITGGTGALRGITEGNFVKDKIVYDNAGDPLVLERFTGTASFA